MIGPHSIRKFGDFGRQRYTSSVFRFAWTGRSEYDYTSSHRQSDVHLSSSADAVPLLIGFSSTGEWDVRIFGNGGTSRNSKVIL
jgi:hypothetical protein